MMMPSAVSAPSLILVCGLAGHVGAQQVHPRAELVVRPAGVTLAPIVLGDTITGLRALSRRGLPGTRLASYGAEDQPAEQVFSGIDDVVRDQVGRTFVMDDKASVVRIFDAQGQVQVLGRHGRGPGEFADLRSIAIDSAGRLYTGEVAHRLQIFEPTAAGFRFGRAIELPVSALGMCFLGGRLFVHALTLGQPGTIYEIGGDGHILRSFGEIYQADDPIIPWQLSTLRIACDASTQTIVAGSRSIGDIRGYAPDGTLRWIAPVSGFRPIRLEQVTVGGRPGTSMSRTPEGEHHITSVTLLRGGLALVQVTLRTWGVNHAPDVVSSLLVETATGRGWSAGRVLPRVIATSDSAYVTGTDDPWPQVQVWRIARPR
jgi:hypothetical protein